MGKVKGKDRKVKRVELKDPEMREFLNRVQGRALVDEDYELIKGMAETLRCLSQSVEDSAASIKRLMRYLFGAPTETAKKLCKKNCCSTVLIRGEPVLLPVSGNTHIPPGFTIIWDCKSDMGFIYGDDNIGPLPWPL